MLQHCTYDKIKLLHELSSLLWFIEQHAKLDAQSANDTNCQKLLDTLAKELEDYISKLHDSLHDAC